MNTFHSTYGWQCIILNNKSDEYTRKKDKGKSKRPIMDCRFVMDCEKVNVCNTPRQYINKASMEGVPEMLRLCL
jgi:hypothetical protein